MKNLKKDEFHGKGTPVSTSESTSAEYEIGDEVYINFGPAGKLGPGRVSAFIHFEDDEGYSFLGYEVALTIQDDRIMKMGYYDASFLKPVNA
jgi:hypothetical protein